jgi:hypothetical protein
MANSEAIEALNKILPCYRRIIPGKTARVSANAALTCV